jgi:hypothetical protein
MESQVWPGQGVILTVLSNTANGAARVSEMLTARLSLA